MLSKKVFAWSDITLALYLKTSFKVILHPLPKGSMWVKYEPICPIWEKICSGQVILDGRTDRPLVKVNTADIHISIQMEYPMLEYQFEV